METNSHCDCRRSASDRTRRTRSQIIYGVLPDCELCRPRKESTAAAFPAGPMMWAWEREPAPGSLQANKTVARLMAKMGYKIGMDVGKPPAETSLPATVGVGCINEPKPFST